MPVHAASDGGKIKTALQLDEQNVEALIGFANAHMWEVNMSYASDDRLAQIRAAETAAKQALALGPHCAKAHMTYGTVLYAMRREQRRHSINIAEAKDQSNDRLRRHRIEASGRRVI